MKELKYAKIVFKRRVAMKRYLGIDLGGCMSGTSAYCLIEGDGKSFTILENVKEPKHKDYQTCHSFLLEKLCSCKAEKIAMDAPLTLPRKLYDKTFNALARDATGEIANPYLFRYTDYYLFKTYGLRPMPPAGDRIGRLTARAMQLLQAKEIETLKDCIIEVYPKQIALELGNVHYKKDPHWMERRLEIDLSNLDDHQIDALLAAYAAMMIDLGHTVEAKDDREGWCFPLKLNSRED